MVETYKYKSKIATAISFMAAFIVYIGKDGLTEIMPSEYAYLSSILIFIAGYILTQKTEDKRVTVAEQMVVENLCNIEDVDPAGEYETLNPEYTTTGDAEDE